VREQVAQVLQSQFRQVGIDLRIKAEPPRIFPDALNKRSFTGLACMPGVERPRVLPRSTLHSEEIPTAQNGWSGQNYPAYRSAEMDRALDAASANSNTAKRRALFATSSASMPATYPCCRCFFASIPSSFPSS